jgi:hypothetical protein
MDRVVSSGTATDSSRPGMLAYRGFAPHEENPFRPGLFIDYKIAGILSICDISTVIRSS